MTNWWQNILLSFVKKNKICGISILKLERNQISETLKNLKKEKKMQNGRSRNFHFRDKKFFLNLYKQDVRYLLEFSTPVWSPWSESDKETLGKNQKQAVNKVSGWISAIYADKLKS